MNRLFVCICYLLVAIGSGALGFAVARMIGWAL